MKKLFFLLAILAICISSFGFAKGQDSTHRGFEFGPSLVTYDGFRILLSRLRDPEENHLSNFKLFNGVQLNYNFKRFSLRTHYNYSNDYVEYAYSGCFAQGSGTVNTKTNQLKLGGQYFFRKNVRRLYAFGDISGTTQSTQKRETDFYTMNSKMKGYGWDIGLGYKVRVYKNLFVSTEISSNTIEGRTNGHYIYYENSVRTRTFDVHYRDNMLVSRVILTMKIK